MVYVVLARRCFRSCTSVLLQYCQVSTFPYGHTSLSLLTFHLGTMQEAQVGGIGAPNEQAVFEFLSNDELQTDSIAGFVSAIPQDSNLDFMYGLQRLLIEGSGSAQDRGIYFIASLVLRNDWAIWARIKTLLPHLEQCVADERGIDEKLLCLQLQAWYQHLASFTEGELVGAIIAKHFGGTLKTVESLRLARINKALASRGLQLVRQKGEGNCLYRCYAYICYGDSNLHEIVRQLIAQGCIDEPALGAEFLVEGDTSAVLNDTLQMKNWGGDLNMAAADQALHVKTVVLGPRGEDIAAIVRGEEVPGAQTAFIYYDGEGHFDACIPSAIRPEDFQGIRPIHEGEEMRELQAAQNAPPPTPKPWWGSSRRVVESLPLNEIKSSLSVFELSSQLLGPEVLEEKVAMAAAKCLIAHVRAMAAPETDEKVLTELAVAFMGGVSMEPTKVNFLRLSTQLGLDAYLEPPKPKPWWGNSRNVVESLPLDQFCRAVDVYELCRQLRGVGASEREVAIPAAKCYVAHVLAAGLAQEALMDRTNKVIAFVAGVYEEPTKESFMRLSAKFGLDQYLKQTKVDLPAVFSVMEDLNEGSLPATVIRETCIDVYNRIVEMAKDLAAREPTKGVLAFEWLVRLTLANFEGPRNGFVNHPVPSTTPFDNPHIGRTTSYAFACDKLFNNREIFEVTTIEKLQALVKSLGLTGNMEDELVKGFNNAASSRYTVLSHAWLFKGTEFDTQGLDCDTIRQQLYVGEYDKWGVWRPVDKSLVIDLLDEPSEDEDVLKIDLELVANLQFEAQKTPTPLLDRRASQLIRKFLLARHRRHLAKKAEAGERKYNPNILEEKAADAILQSNYAADLFGRCTSAPEFLKWLYNQDALEEIVRSEDKMEAGEAVLRGSGKQLLGYTNLKVYEKKEDVEEEELKGKGMVYLLDICKSAETLLRGYDLFMEKPEFAQFANTRSQMTQNRLRELIDSLKEEPDLTKVLHKIYVGQWKWCSDIAKIDVRNLKELYADLEDAKNDSIPPLLFIVLTMVRLAEENPDYMPDRHYVLVDLDKVDLVEKVFTIFFGSELNVVKGVVRFSGNFIRDVCASKGRDDSIDTLDERIIDKMITAGAGSIHVYHRRMVNNRDALVQAAIRERGGLVPKWFVKPFDWDTGKYKELQRLGEKTLCEQASRFGVKLDIDGLDGSRDRGTTNIDLGSQGDFASKTRGELFRGRPFMNGWGLVFAQFGDEEIPNLLAGVETLGIPPRTDKFFFKCERFNTEDECEFSYSNTLPCKIGTSNNQKAERYRIQTEAFDLRFGDRTETSREQLIQEMLSEEGHKWEIKKRFLPHYIPTTTGYWIIKIVE